VVANVVVGVGEVEGEHEVVTTRQPPQHQRFEAAVLVEPAKVDDEPALALVRHDERVRRSQSTSLARCHAPVPKQRLRSLDALHLSSSEKEVTPRWNALGRPHSAHGTRTPLPNQ